MFLLSLMTSSYKFTAYVKKLWLECGALEPFPGFAPEMRLQVGKSKMEAAGKIKFEVKARAAG